MDIIELHSGVVQWQDNGLWSRRSWFESKPRSQCLFCSRNVPTFAHITLQLPLQSEPIELLCRTPILLDCLAKLFSNTGSYIWILVEYISLLKKQIIAAV